MLTMYLLLWAHEKHAVTLNKIKNLRREKELKIKNILKTVIRRNLQLTKKPNCINKIYNITKRKQVVEERWHPHFGKKKVGKGQK